jgi:tellurite resistance protein TerC
MKNMEVFVSFWIMFHVVVAVFLTIDFVYWERKRGKIKFKDSLLWTVVWIALGLLFSIVILSVCGAEEFIRYITAYFVEKFLSIDNLLVFLTIFTYFAVPPGGRHIVLLAGIIFAIILRGTFIFVGISLLKRFHWMTYVFGTFLMYTGFTMVKRGRKALDPRKNKVVNFAKKFLPIIPTFGKNGKSFIIKQNGKVLFTPLFLTLLAIETTDIMFAFDSIPAVLAVTREFFTAYTSNIMAILGLRSLYFLLEHSLKLVENLKKGLAIYLIYLGITFILSAFSIRIPPFLSFLWVVILFILSCIIKMKKNKMRLKAK